MKRIRSQNKARQNVKRSKQKELKMAEKVAAEMAEMTELYELAEELLELPLPAAIDVVATWQRDKRRPFPALFNEPRGDHETIQAHSARREKARKFGLIRLMAVDYIKNVGNRRRKADFNDNEAKDAVALGFGNVDAYRKHKKHVKLTAKMEKVVADRAAA
ncbi:hypothetical protein EPK99_15615 [Neorhizobium lilium]|uniref:Uncharacterized protein n=1 Tax=Neorhizobium lilium TaxID=2503024 RepID=A0A3S3VLE2_9HYPH|nr:hypothetical protein [Neorhizobium lilium]RWX77081.1 hypothetical protein EPK99_15615 [Neorhizobium lilium]